MFHINTQIPRHGSTGAYIPGPRPHSTTPALSLSPLPPPSLYPCARRPSPLLRTSSSSSSSSLLLAIAPPGPIFGALYLSLALSRARTQTRAPSSSPSAPPASSLARTVARAAPPNTFVVASLLARLLALIQGPRFSLHLSSSSSSSSFTLLRPTLPPSSPSFFLSAQARTRALPDPCHTQFCASYTDSRQYFVYLAPNPLNSAPRSSPFSIFLVFAQRFDSSFFLRIQSYLESK